MTRRTTIGMAALTVALLLAACSPSGMGRGATGSGSDTSTTSAVATTSVPATSSATATASAEATVPAVTIGWVGDTTPGSRYGLPPRKGRALYEKVRDQLLAPDIMVGNLEGTFGSGGESKGDGAKMYSFQAPPAYADALAWAGFDLMSVANNHAHDYLDAGMVSTRKALRDAGIAYAGAPGQITVVETEGVRVAFIAVSPYPWNQSIADIKGTAALVRTAKKDADVVIVLMHAGAEGSGQTHTPKGAEHAFGEFRGAPRKFAHAMIDAGATAVLGSGPHVIRGVERYEGRLIAYSLGNFGGWGNFGTSGTLGLSGVLTIRVDRNGEVLDASWTSLRLNGNGAPAIDPRGRSLKLVRKLSREDFADPWPIASVATTETAAQ